MEQKLIWFKCNVTKLKMFQVNQAGSLLIDFEVNVELSMHAVRNKTTMIFSVMQVMQVFHRKFISLPEKKLQYFSAYPFGVGETNCSQGI